MKFNGLEISWDGYGEKRTLKGRLKFVTENNDWLNLSLQHEDLVKMMELAIPIFEKATSDRIEFIKEEFTKAVKDV